MAGKEKIFDDIARVAGSGIGILSGAQKQIREEIHAYLNEQALKLDLVPREEFERLEIMLTEAREKQDALEKKVKDLETKLNTKK